MDFPIQIDKINMTLSRAADQNFKILLFLSLKKIRIHHECEGRIEKSVLRIAVWHHQACRVMTVIPREGFFYPTLTPIKDNFSCSPLFLFMYLFQNKLPEVPE